MPARPPPEGVPAVKAGSRPWAPLSGSQVQNVFSCRMCSLVECVLLGAFEWLAGTECVPL